MQAKAPAGLGSDADFHLGLDLVDGRHLESRQRRRHHRNSEHGMQIGAVAEKQILRATGAQWKKCRDRRRKTRDERAQGLAFARKANARAVSRLRDIDPDKRSVPRGQKHARNPRMRAHGFRSSAADLTTGEVSSSRSKILRAARGRRRRTTSRSSAWCRLAPVPEKDSQVTETNLIWAVLPVKAPQA